MWRACGSSIIMSILTRENPQTETARNTCCCCCCCSHIISHNQVRGHKTGTGHSGAEEYPRETLLKNKQLSWGKIEVIFMSIIFPVYTTGILRSI